MPACDINLGLDLENDTEAVGASRGRRAVEVALSIKHQVAIRTAPVAAAGEIV